jgi:hypothetical protein
MTLLTFAQVDSGIVTADVCEIVSAPFRIRETQDINEITNTARHILDVQDRLRTFKSGSVHRLILPAHPSAKQGKPTPVLSPGTWMVL